jgi:hypothetical protein
MLSWRITRLISRAAVACAIAVMLAAVAAAQTVTVVRNVSLRPEQSSQEPAIRLLTPDEPPMTLLEPHLQDGYFRARR